MMQQMQQEPWNAAAVGLLRPTKSAPCSPIKPPPAAMVRTHSDSFHVAHKVPVGDTPYVRAKRVQVSILRWMTLCCGRIGFDLIRFAVPPASVTQLVDKDPEKAIALFWSAINAGDRVDSALKDMAIVMKQQNRAEEAIEAIKSLRSRCSDQAQESLDNILLDLYKVRVLLLLPRIDQTLCACMYPICASEMVLNLSAFLLMSRCAEMRAAGRPDLAAQAQAAADPPGPRLQRQAHEDGAVAGPQVPSHPRAGSHQASCKCTHFL
jgi:hypothetical protein